MYYTGSPRLRTKTRTALNLIGASQGGKFIVFSAFRDDCRALKSLLEKGGSGHASLQGGTADTETLARFRAGGAKVLFLTAKQPGTGLNLEFATDLILYHEVSPSLEAVLVGRAHRLGRRLAEPLRIHHLKPG